VDAFVQSIFDYLKRDHMIVKPLRNWIWYKEKWSISCQYINELQVMFFSLYRGDNAKVLRMIMRKETHATLPYSIPRHVLTHNKESNKRQEMWIQQYANTSGFFRQQLHTDDYSPLNNVYLNNYW